MNNEESQQNVCLALLRGARALAPFSLVADTANVLGMLQPHDNAIPVPTVLAYGHQYKCRGTSGVLVLLTSSLSCPNLNDIALRNVIPLSS